MGNLPELNGYKVIRRLNSGAVADVFEAETLDGERVALKRIRRPLTDVDARREFESLRVIKHLRHTQLVQVHSYWVHDERLCVVMDLADCSLRERLQECLQEAAAERELAGIPPLELIGYFLDAAEALDYLHSKNVLHRDVKPDNILLFKNRHRRAPHFGGAYEVQARAKLADFDLAKLLECHRAEASGCGTLRYMAPEACRNCTNGQSDQYSLAASYVELRLGRPLFPYTSIHELTRAHILETPNLDPLPLQEQRVLLRALAKDPDERWVTCMQFVTALDHVLSQPPPEPREVADVVQVPAARTKPRTPLRPSSAPRARRGRSVGEKLAATLTVLVALASMPAFLFWALTRSPEFTLSVEAPAGQGSRAQAVPEESPPRVSLAERLQQAAEVLDHDPQKALELYRSAESPALDQATQGLIQLGKARALARQGRWDEVRQILTHELSLPPEQYSLRDVLMALSASPKTTPEVMLATCTQLKGIKLDGGGWERQQLNERGARLSKELTLRLEQLAAGDPARQLARDLITYDPDNTTACAHAETLDAIQGLRGLPPKVPRKDLVQQLETLGASDRRLTELCQATAELAERDSLCALRLSQFLDEAAPTLPASLKPFVPYVGARAAETGPTLTLAATQLAKALKQGQEFPFVQEDAERKQWAASLFFRAAAAARGQDALASPYPEAAQALQAWEWLSTARWLQPQVESELSFRIEWVLATWFRWEARHANNRPAPEAAQVRQWSSELLKVWQSAPGKTELDRHGSMLLLVHAQAHETTDPASAVRSYAELVKGLPAKEADEEALQRLVVQPAMQAFGRVPVTARDRPVQAMAELYTVHARLRESAGARGDPKGTSEAIMSYDQAARLDRTVARVATRIGAHLALAPAALPAELRQDAEWLVTPEHDRPGHRRFLVQVLCQLALNESDEVKQLSLLRELRAACDEGGKKCQAHPTELDLIRECVTVEQEARVTVHEPIHQLVLDGEWAAALEWAEKIKDADPVLSALVKGRVHARQGGPAWQKARAALEAALPRAVRKGDLWHVRLRTGYVEVLTELDAAAPAESKLSPELLKEQATKLLELLNAEATGLPVPTSDLQGLAYGAAGVAWHHVAWKLTGVPKQHACQTAIAHLQQAIKKNPSTSENGLWYLTYGSATLELFEMDESEQNENACHAAAKQLEKVLPSKMPAWCRELGEKDRNEAAKEMLSRIKNLEAPRVWKAEVKKRQSQKPK